VKLRIRYRVGVGKRRHPAKVRHRFDQDFLSFAVKFGCEDADACCISARLSQRVHQSRPDHIVSNSEDRKRRRCQLRRANCGVPGGINDIDAVFDEILCES
jgi:hypothetical protein